MGKFIDLTGQRFGSLTVKSKIPKDHLSDAMKRTGGAYWLCDCECGGGRISITTYLRSGKVFSCSACAKEMSRIKISIDIAGNRYGMLVAVEREEPSPGRQGSMWRFACDCGQETVARLKDVRYGNTLSCGCMKSPKGRALGKQSMPADRPWLRQAAI